MSTAAAAAAANMSNGSRNAAMNNQSVRPLQTPFPSTPGGCKMVTMMDGWRESGSGNSGSGSGSGSDPTPTPIRMS